jgi:D-alanyl-D-alanine carboxypeptidase
MPTHRSVPFRVSRVLVVLLITVGIAGVGPASATGPVPGAVAAEAGPPGAAAAGAVDNAAQWFPRSATLPLRGAQFGGAGLPPALTAAPVQAWKRKVRARYAILVDAATGEVLWGRRSRTPAPPASLTKMLTALAVRASLDLDALTVASRKAAAQPARRLAMRRGQKLTVDQALKALMIVSANDVAVMLAEAAGGSVARFARAMDAESARLGLRASSWRNPHGLDARGHRSTAFDLAILTRAVLRDPWLAKVVRKRHAAFVSPSGRRHSLTARSRFLLGYRGAVGVKTGFTDDAGHCLAAAATRGGRTLIAVVLHSPDNAADAGRMLDWGFGRGRSAQTGLRLPGPVKPASADSLLASPPPPVQRHRPAAPDALTSAGLARVRATPAAPPARSQPSWSWQDRQRVATAAGAVVALLLAVGIAVHRLR